MNFLRLGIMSAVGRWISAAVFTVLTTGSPACAKDLGIWRVEDSTQIPVRQLIADISRKSYVVIGETHGNAVHQNREAFLIGALAAKDRQPVIVFEMLSGDATAAVAAYRRDNPEDAAGLGAAIGWDRSGWPDFAFYRPVFESALRARLPIIGGDLSLGRHDTAASAMRADAGPQLASWSETMKAAHCGLIEPTDLLKSARLQIQRDNAMAAAGLGHGEQGAVFVVGLAHARADRGIPQRLPQDRTVVIGLIESGDSDDPSSYLPKAITGSRTFDYLWFSPKRAEEGTCDRLRRKNLIR